MEFKYRAINPHDEEDIKKLLNIQEELGNHLNCGAKPLTEEQIKWLRIRMGATELLPQHQQQDDYSLGLQQKPDEISIVAEFEGEIIGYVEIATYHLVKGKRPDDDIGLLHEIFVKEQYRNTDISFKLLQMGVKKLIECGKFRAICNVQEDNKQRFLHFAMADGNVIETSTCKRKDGTKTTDYTLLIDLKKLQNTTKKELGFKAAKLRREYEVKQNITI